MKDRIRRRLLKLKVSFLKGGKRPRRSIPMPCGTRASHSEANCFSFPHQRPGHLLSKPFGLAGGGGRHSRAFEIELRPCQTLPPLRSCAKWLGTGPARPCCRTTGLGNWLQGIHLLFTGEGGTHIRHNNRMLFEQELVARPLWSFRKTFWVSFLPMHLNDERRRYAACRHLRAAVTLALVPTKQKPAKRRCDFGFAFPR